MIARFTIPVQKLDVGFLAYLHANYEDFVLQINVVSEEEIKKRKVNQDTTEYLLSSKANRKKLEEAIQNIKDGKVISFTIDELDDEERFLEKVKQINSALCVK